MSPTELVDFYCENLRSGLFTASITMTAFLFSIRTFLVATLKKEVYEDKYLRDVADFDLANGIKRRDPFKPLKQINNFIFWATILCFASAFSQFTLGLIKHPLASIASMIMALLAGVSLFLVLVGPLRISMNSWFEVLDSRAKEIASAIEKEKQKKKKDSET